jgi:hypothetical protein
MGLVPKKSSEKGEIMHLVMNNKVSPDGVDFVSLLSLITKSREMLQFRLMKVLKQHFPVWATNEEEGVPAASLCNNLFKVLSIVPRSRKEQRAVNRVIREADVDGDDRYTLSEAMVICRRAQELLTQMKRQEEMAIATEIGLTEVELNQARFAFEELDSDDSFSLDQGEVKKALALLNTKCSPEELSAAFKRLDSDNSGSLEFPEFLRLIKVMQSGEGNSAAPGSKKPVTTLGALTRPELASVLHCYTSEPEDVLGAQEAPALLRRLCQALGLQPDSSLESALTVTTMDGLCNAVRHKAAWGQQGS